MTGEPRGGTTEPTDARIATLEAAVADLTDRVRKLESRLATLNEFGGEIARLRSEVEEYQQPP